MDDNSDARVSHDGIPTDPGRKVDGSRVDDEPPSVVSVFVERPLRGVFGARDTITVRLGFNEGRTVTGEPRFALRIGTQTGFATFRETLGSTTLLFDYVVDESDRDDNGLSIAAGAVDLNGGSIRDKAGNDANLDLGYFAFNDNPEYKVDGRMTAVPALPVGGALGLLFALLGGGGGAWRVERSVNGRARSVSARGQGAARDGGSRRGWGSLPRARCSSRDRVCRC